MPSVKVIFKNRTQDKKDEGRLYLQIINARKDKSEISLKVKLKPELWDDKKQVIRAGHPQSGKLNTYIRIQRLAYENLIADKRAQGIPFTVKEIVQERKENIDPTVNKDSFMTYFKNYIEQNPENLRFNTVKSYRTCYNKLVEYSPGLTFGQFDEKWVQRFEKQLINEHQAINTIADKMKVLKKVARLAQEEGKLKHFSFKNYKIKTEPGKRDYLTEEEFKRLCNVEVSTEKQDMVKDVFIFACVTGLRFSDLSVLTTANITEGIDDAGKVVLTYSLRMQKTNEMLSSRLSQRAVDILMKYGFPELNPILPILQYPPNRYTSEESLKKAISRRNAYFNKVIKLLCKKAEINKSISMHCSRHTFATLSLDLGVPVQVVSKLLGHKNLQETMIYSKIMDKQKDAAIDKWDKI